MKLPQKIIDTNVILRFLLGDNEEKFERSKIFFEKLEFGADEVLLTEMVFAEVVWVLNKVYEVPRKEIAENFAKLITCRGIKTVFEKDLFIESLNMYTTHSSDIQDVFLAVVAKDKECTIVTFDKTDFKKMKAVFIAP